MALTLRQLEIFRAIAGCGSTSEAAKRLPLSQSATSAALLELETTLTVRLFDRVGKRLVLNDSGRSLMPLALALLDGARTVQASFSGTLGAIDLKLFASTTIGNYLLPGLIAGFRAANTGAVVDLRIGNTFDVVAAVSAFDTDLGFIEGPCHASDIEVLPWLEDELVIVASPTHPLAHLAKRGRLTADQLRRAVWLMREPGSGTRETLEQALLPHLAQFATVMTIGSPEAIKNAVAEGLGISCLSRYAALDFVATQRLCILATRLPRLTRHLMLIHHSKKLLSAPLVSFIAQAKQFAESTRRQDFEI
jgi:DNA-binding transcriptional LysR family regulator